MADTQKLYSMLQTRVSPETVAEYLLEVLPDQTAADQVLNQAKRQRYWGSSMPDDFNRPKTKIARQLAAIPVLFGVALPEDPTLFVSQQIEAWHGIKIDKRSSKATRRAAGIYKSARWFNKRRRLLKAVQAKALKFGEQNELYLFTRVSKAALSVEVPYDRFAADLNTAALVTYLAARMNRRSVFTNKAQDRAFDVIAKRLLERCEDSSTTDWFVVAHVMPDAKVLARLSDEHKGYLVGRWFALLQSMSEWLGRLWARTRFNRETMVVQRGDDSSTWNAVAGAWNRAREHWISLVYAISGETVLDAVCPGKVMRLMAGDVARWHKLSGGALHPDTMAWAALPPPWDVLSGKTVCGLKEVRTVCDQVGADIKTWVQREGRQAVAFKPTPELVHGVEVGSPGLARLLRKAGVFSGKGIRGFVPGIDIERDSNGAAVFASEVSISGSSTRAGGSYFRQAEE